MDFESVELRNFVGEIFGWFGFVVVLVFKELVGVFNFDFEVWDMIFVVFVLIGIIVIELLLNLVDSEIISIM